MNFDNVDFDGYSLSDKYIEDHIEEYDEEYCDDYADEDNEWDQDVLDYFDGEDDEF